MTTEISFNPFPVLESQKIILRRLKDTDNINISKLRSDKIVNEFLDRPKMLSQEDAGDLIKKLNDDIENDELIFWAISMPDQEELIGTIFLWNLDREFGLAEIGFELLPEFQGKGLMYEAVKMVLKYAIHKMNLVRIEVFMNKNNTRSFKLMERSGFTRDFELEKEIKSNEPDFVNKVAFKLEK